MAKKVAGSTSELSSSITCMQFLLLQRCAAIDWTQLQGRLPPPQQMGGGGGVNGGMFNSKQGTLSKVWLTGRHHWACDELNEAGQFDKMVADCRGSATPQGKGRCTTESEGCQFGDHSSISHAVAGSSAASSVLP